MTKPVALILHSPLAENAPADELDVLDQAQLFSDALHQLGFETYTTAFPLDFGQLTPMLRQHNSTMVVNLTETLMGSGRLVHVAPFLLETAGIPFTGCSGHSMYLSSHKLLAKEHMQRHGIPTPRAMSLAELLSSDYSDLPSPFLVKSLWEHASFGMDESKPLLFSHRSTLLQRWQQEIHPEEFFCEEYIHGREFNLSVLGTKHGPRVLPPAEIQFFFPEDKPRILGYKAKWEEESFEYKNTVRTFDFPPHDAPLLESLKSIALQCREVFGMRGYARVDFRVDENGQIFVLEINANPCIAPDSGFVAAALQAGMPAKELVKNILEDSGIACP